MSRRSWQGMVAVSLLATFGIGLAAGCGEGQSLVGGSCADGYTLCGDLCVDLNVSPQSCGSCNAACSAGVACIGGSCGGEVDGAGLDGGDTTTDGGLEPSETAPSDGPLGNESQTDAPIADAPTPDALSSDDSSADAPASDSPASDAPANDAPASDSPASDAPANDAPASDSPASDAPASDAPANDAPVNDDAGAEGGDDSADEPLCQSPLIDCGGVCVDTTVDPGNCGACGRTCYSGICQSSNCAGETTGTLVFIGHDYASYSLAQARILSNAVLLPQASQSVPVLSYERYASSGALNNVKAIISAAAKSVGRTVSLTPTTTDSDVATGLTIDKYGVLLVADQVNAPTGALATLGASWMTVLAAFTQAGGVVVILDGDTGVQETPELVTATGLLSVSAQTAVPIFTQVSVVGLTDALALGVGNRYAAGSNSASFTTEPAATNVVYVVTTPTADGGPGSPVVVHKVF